jgi:hypothetical protein
MTHLVDGGGQQVSERKKGKQINKIPQMFVIHSMCIFIKKKELPSTFITYSPALAQYLVLYIYRKQPCSLNV